MDRTEGSNFINIGGGRRGFQDQNAEAGVPGTRVTADHLNAIQEEILAVIENAGILPDKANWKQLDTAIRKLTTKIVNDYNIPLAQLNCLPWLPVINLSQKAPPAKPAVGDMYVVPEGGNGEWSNKAGQIAEWNGSKWVYSTPKDGHGIGLPDGSIYIRINGKYVLLTDIFDKRYSKFPAPPAYTFYVVGPSGNDKNSGLAPTPTEGFATIQGAVDALCNYMTQGTITVKIAPGTYDSVIIQKSSVAKWSFEGDLTNADRVKIVAANVSGKSTAFTIKSNTDVTLESVTLLAVTGCIKSLNGTVDIKNCNLNIVPDAKGIECYGGDVSIYGNMRVTGKGDSIFLVASGGNLNIGYVDKYQKYPVNITFNNVTTTGAVFLVRGGSNLIVSAPVVKFIGVPTGTAYGVIDNAIIGTWGAGPGIFPGTQSGYARTGGQIVY